METIEQLQNQIDKLEKEYKERYKAVQDFTVSNTAVESFFKWSKFNREKRRELARKINELRNK